MCGTDTAYAGRFVLAVERGAGEYRDGRLGIGRLLPYAAAVRCPVVTSRMLVQEPIRGLRRYRGKTHAICLGIATVTQPLAAHCLALPQRLCSLATHLLCDARYRHTQRAVGVRGAVLSQRPAASVGQRARAPGHDHRAQSQARGGGPARRARPLAVRGQVPHVQHLRVTSPQCARDLV